jgi:hypothetical protein
MPACLPDIIVGFGLGVGLFALVTLIFSLQTSSQQPEADVVSGDQFWLMAFTGILALATVALAISTIGLWKYAGGQAHDMQELLQTMKGQLEEAKQSFAADRAYVLFSHFESHSGVPMVPKKRVEITFRNFGRTPADMRWNGAQCKYYAGSPPTIIDESIPGYTDTEGRLASGYIIGHDSDYGPFSYEIDVTQEEIDRAKAGDGTIYCTAVISYDDMRGNSHKTGVCFFWVPTFDRFVLFPDARWNFHT